jgi:hypothetical protein
MQLANLDLDRGRPLVSLYVAFQSYQLKVSIGGSKLDSWKRTEAMASCSEGFGLALDDPNMRFMLGPLIIKDIRCYIHLFRPETWQPNVVSGQNPNTPMTSFPPAVSQLGLATNLFLSIGPWPQGNTYHVQASVHVASLRTNTFI